MLKKISLDSPLRSALASQSETLPLIKAVQQGKQAGSIFADRLERPDLIFTLHKSGFSFFDEKGSFTQYEELISFLTGCDEIPIYFHIYSPPKGLLEAVRRSVRVGYKLRERVRLHHRGAWSEVKASGSKLTAQEITSGNILSLKESEVDLCKFWDSHEQFLSEGYGVFLRDEASRPTSVCYSACVVDKMAEIDILTMAAYQRMGLAKWATSLFVRQSLDRDILPRWDCFEDNVGSLRTALQCGFEVRERYPLLSVYLKGKAPQ